MHGLPFHLSGRPYQSEFKGNNGATTPGLPIHHSHSLTISYLQDTNSVISSGSSSPNRECYSVGENRTHHLHPSGNSTTQQGLYSQGNLIQLLSRLHPIYPANWVQNTRGRENLSHQTISDCLRT